MLKKLIIVIFISMFIGAFIFFAVNTFFSDNKSKTNPLKKVSSLLNHSPSPLPSPTIPPINENTNLEAEIKTLTPKDHSPQIENLKQEVNGL